MSTDTAEALRTTASREPSSAFTLPTRRERSSLDEEERSTFKRRGSGRFHPIVLLRRSSFTSLRLESREGWEGASSLLARRARFAPLLQQADAIALPIPLEAPVIRTVLP